MKLVLKYKDISIKNEFENVGLFSSGIFELTCYNAYDIPNISDG